MGKGVTIRVRIGMMGSELRNNRCLFFGMPGKFQFNPIKGNKNFLILGNDNNMRLKPAPVFRRGFGYKTIIGALWLFLRM